LKLKVHQANFIYNFKTKKKCTGPQYMKINTKHDIKT